MKAKYLLLILGIFYCMGVRAIEREIILYNSSDSPEEEWVKDERSVSIEPTATIDENTIRIYSDVTISGLQVSITDNMGNVVYSYKGKAPSRCYTFEVYELPTGEYTLIFEIGEKVYYGGFIIQ